MTYEQMYGSGTLTFGTFPALVVGGKGVLNQTQVIKLLVHGASSHYGAAHDAPA